MRNSLVSVIIPFNGCDLYLREAVDSVLAQTHLDFEVIVVDDCSPGQPAQVILSQYDPKIVKIFCHSQNAGPSAARNTAVLHAQGEYIVPLDADDLLVPSYLEKAVDAVYGTEYGGAYTDIELFGNENLVHNAECTIGGILNCRGGASTFLYKKAVFDSVGGYKPEWRLGEDKDFWLSAYAKGWKFVHIKEPLHRYRRHEGSLSFGVEAGAADVILRLFQEHKSFLIESIDEWFPEKERHLWLQRQLYQEIYSEWQSACRNYQTLESEYKEKCLRLENEVSELKGRTLKSQLKSVLKKVSR